MLSAMNTVSCSYFNFCLQNKSLFTSRSLRLSVVFSPVSALAPLVLTKSASFTRITSEPSLRTVEPINLRINPPLRLKFCHLDALVIVSAYDQASTELENRSAAPSYSQSNKNQMFDIVRRFQWVNLKE